MRILVVVGAILGATALSVGGAVLVALNTPDNEHWAWLSGAAGTAYLIAPLMLGGLAAFWNTTSSPEARRGYRRSLLAAVGGQVVATVLMCVYTALTGAAWWLTVVFTGVGIAAMALAVKLGPTLNRSERARPVSPGPWTYGRGEFRRDLRRILVTVGVTLVASAAAMGVLLGVFAPDEFGLLFLWAPVFAVMGGGIACVVVMMRLSRRIRGLVDEDMGRAKRIGTVVVRGKAIALTPEEAELAVPFASLSWVVQAYSITWLVVLFLSLGLMQVVTFLDDPSDPLPLWFVAVIVVLLVAVLPVTVIQLRRTRAYARRSDSRVSP